MDRHAQGIPLIFLSAVAYSSAGFFTQLIHLEAWTMLFWRGLFAGLMSCASSPSENGATHGARYSQSVVPVSLRQCVRVRPET